MVERRSHSPASGVLVLQAPARSVPGHANRARFRPVRGADRCPTTAIDRGAGARCRRAGRRSDGGSSSATRACARSVTRRCASARPPTSTTSATRTTMPTRICGARADPATIAGPARSTGRSSRIEPEPSKLIRARSSPSVHSGPRRRATGAKGRTASSSRSIEPESRDIAAQVAPMLATSPRGRTARRRRAPVPLDACNRRRRRR